MAIPLLIPIIAGGSLLGLGGFLGNRLTKKPDVVESTQTSVKNLTTNQTNIMSISARDKASLTFRGLSFSPKTEQQALTQQENKPDLSSQSSSALNTLIVGGLVIGGGILALNYLGGNK